MQYTIELEGVERAFGGRPVLRGLDLRVQAGSVHALLGPNGAGKTTTVRILSTLLAPDAGRVAVAGHDVLRDPDAVRRAISLTGQHAAVDALLTGRENLHLMARLRHLGRAEGRARTRALLERFSLTDAADRRAAQYSGGMVRRLDLAMSLVSDPQVLVLDEPTTGLDPRSRRDVWGAVSGLAASGVTVLLTTQYLEEADVLADRIAVVDHGHVVAEGTADDLKALVGGETVELLFAEAGELDAAARAVAGQPDPERMSLRVPTDGSAAGVRAVLDAVAAAGIAVQRLALHRPTLDDAFLALTGEPAPGRAGR